MQQVTFEQVPLFTGGYRLLTAQMVLHVDGSHDRIEVGYSIHETGTDNVIELGTLGILTGLRPEQALANVAKALIEQARKHLLPF